MADEPNPTDYADRVKGLPQVHFGGTNDTTVPTSVANRFAHAAGTRCAHVVEVPGLAHDDDWAARWVDLLKVKPKCDLTTERPVSSPAQ